MLILRPSWGYYDTNFCSCFSSADVNLSEYTIDPAIYDYGDAETSDYEDQVTERKIEETKFGSNFPSWKNKLYLHFQKQTDAPKPKSRGSINEEEEYDAVQVTPEKEIPKSKFTIQGVKVKDYSILDKKISRVSRSSPSF